MSRPWRACPHRAQGKEAPSADAKCKALAAVPLRGGAIVILGVSGVSINRSNA